MKSNILFTLLALLCQRTLGTSFPKRTPPTQNMNGEYLISNPNQASEKQFSTLYSDRSNVEFFDVYSQEISTRYVPIPILAVISSAGLIVMNIYLKIWRGFLDYE